MVLWRLEASWRHARAEHHTYEEIGCNRNKAKLNLMNVYIQLPLTTAGFSDHWLCIIKKAASSSE